MGKKILILNGSPRSKGNTMGLIKSFTEGAEEAGNEVIRFDLQQMEIHPCLGCYKGGEDPKSPCVQKDDMDQIYQAYTSADVLVLASPMYFWTISGQLKCALDRIFALAEIKGDYQGFSKDCVLLMAAESNEFEEIVHYYNGLMKHLGWNSLGTVLASGVNHVGDIEGKPILSEARELGLSIR